MRHVINAANGKNQKRPPTATALPRLNVRYWPILLKKSAMVSTVEKYALEIEIFTLSRGFAAQISHSDAQKGMLSSQYVGSLEVPTFSTESA